MLGLIAIYAFQAKPLSGTLDLAYTTQVTGPIASVIDTDMDAFQVLYSQRAPARFIGLAGDGSIRLDLIGNKVRATNAQSSNFVWQAPCDDAALSNSLVYCLRKNSLLTLNLAGRVLSSRRLVSHGIDWEYLDPNVGFAMGFEKIRQRSTWSLRMLQFSNSRITKLNVTVDPGGAVDPSICSDGTNCAIIYDLFYVYVIRAGLNSGHTTISRRYDGFVVRDTTVLGGDLVLMLQRVRDGDMRLVNVSRDRTLVDTATALDGFVKGSKELKVYHCSDRTLNVYFVK